VIAPDITASLEEERDIENEGNGVLGVELQDGLADLPDDEVRNDVFKELEFEWVSENDAGDLLAIGDERVTGTIEREDLVEVESLGCHPSGVELLGNFRQVEDFVSIDICLDEAGT
jgi:hypothetical protein